MKRNRVNPLIFVGNLPKEFGIEKKERFSAYVDRNEGCVQNEEKF